MMEKNLQAAYERNGQLVSSDAFYAIACDPRRSVAVEACAGAGKTWMLVSRIVRALLDGAMQAPLDGAPAGASGCQPQQILAITFTRRAAGEMRERLYEWLAEFANADRAKLLNELQIRGVTGLNDEAHASRLTRQLAGLYSQMLATGRSVQIRTFHSWFASLLRTAPVVVLQNLGLPVNYELLEDDAPARALVWRKFYELLVKNASLKSDFEAVVQGYGRSQTDKALQAALDKRVEFGLADLAGVVDESVQSFLQQFPQFEGVTEPEELLVSSQGRAVLVQAAICLGRASAPTFAAKGSELEMALTEGNTSGMMDALLTGKGEARKFSEKIAGIEDIRAAQDLVVAVQAARHQHEAWVYQQRMARLSRALIAEFAEVKRERGWVDMNDVERAAHVMLGDPVLSGWVQEKLDAHVRHLLIDEFQDTNPLQWQALLAWLGSYAGAGQAPSVFIVGDPKQSIYRFRRAEPQVFRAAQEFVRSGLGGDLLSCDHTRRNAQKVISTVNTAMLAATGLNRYEGFRTHSTDSKKTGEVFRLTQIPRLKADEADASEAGSGSAPWRDSLTTPREVPEETLRTLEARQAAQMIALQLNDPQRPLQARDVMVLSRKRAGLLPLQEELRALHIPAQIGEKTALIDCCEVLDIVALLDALVSPQHDLSLARALRSPLFGVTNEALIQLALAQRRLEVPWYELLQRHAKSLLACEPSGPAGETGADPAGDSPGLSAVHELDAPQAACLKGVAATLGRWKGWLDSLPPHDAMNEIYHDGDVLARFAAVSSAQQRSAVLTNLTELLSVALQFDGGRFITPYALVRALKAGGIQAPAAVSGNAVRLLTIHGAKGLEAEVVLLLDTDTPPRSADSMGVLVDWPGEASAPDKFVFLVSESRPPACCVQSLETEVHARQREELNALYVALTRARQTLLISSITPHRATTDSWWKQLHDLAVEMPAADEVAPMAAPVKLVIQAVTHPGAVAANPSAATQTAAEEEFFHLPVLPHAPILERLDAAADADQDSSSTRVGKAMHRLLEWGGLSEGHVRAVTREFRLDPSQAQAALRGARQILSGDGAWAWDPRVVNWQGNEVELAFQGNTVRLDRLVQRQDAGHEGQWWVLDYKSRRDPQTQPELLAQMRTYRAALQAVYPGQTVRTAFLTAQGTVEEVD